MKSCNKNAKIYKKDISIEQIGDKYVLKARIEMIEDIGNTIKIYTLKEN